MVLDVKVLTWAKQNGIDTAKLKAAKVPIYGKWYFPELPASELLVNLETGERRTFPARMIAGLEMWVPVAALRRAGLGVGPEAEAEAPKEEPIAAVAAKPTPAPEAPEPMIAMARAPGGVERAEAAAPVPVTTVFVPIPEEALVPEGEVPPIHLPRPSIGPFVLGVGLSIALVGIITHVALLVIGLIWVLVGAIAWIRVGVLEAPSASTSGDEHSATVVHS